MHIRLKGLILLLFIITLFNSCKVRRVITAHTLNEYEILMKELTIKNGTSKKMKDRYFSINVAQEGGIGFQIIFDEYILSKTRGVKSKYAIYVNDKNQHKLIQEKINSCEIALNVKFEQVFASPSKKTIENTVENWSTYILPFNGGWKELIEVSKCLLNSSYGKITAETISLN